MKKLMMKAIGGYLNSLALVAPGKAAIKGFQLFCRPFRAPLKKYHLDFLSSAEQFTVPFNQQQLQAYRWGKGERKVLFLHGWQSHTFRWKTYIESLLADGAFTVYAVDAPGHGLSSGNFLTVPLYSDLILHLVDTLGDMDSIVSHSMGGFSTLYSFYRQPALPVNKVVLMGSPGEARDFFDFYRSQLGLSPRTAGVIEDHFVSIFQQKPDYFSAAMFADGLPARGLIIHDEGDLEAPVQYARRIHDAWPNSTLVTTQGLGHNLKSPHVVGMVTDFVRQGSAQQAAKHYYENAITN